MIQRPSKLHLTTRRSALVAGAFALCVLLAYAWQVAWGVRGVAVSGWQQWAILLVVSPVLEEWVFRRGLHDALRAGRRVAQIHFMHGWVSLTNLVVALTFSAFHAFSQGWLALGVIAPALVIGAVFERNGRLKECILLHAGFNAAWITALWLRA